MSKPSLDQDLGTVLTPEFTNCPPILVAEAQLRLWLGASEARAIKTAQVFHQMGIHLNFYSCWFKLLIFSQLVTGVKGADASLAVCGTIVEANGAQHAVIALAIKEDNPNVNLPDLVLHW